MQTSEGNGTQVRLARLGDAAALAEDALDDFFEDAGGNGFRELALLAMVSASGSRKAGGV